MLQSFDRIDFDKIEYRIFECCKTQRRANGINSIDEMMTRVDTIWEDDGKLRSCLFGRVCVCVVYGLCEHVCVCSV
jgi:hypothetical protein